MTATFQPATPGDLPVLLRLMGEFNTGGGYPADPARTEPLLVQFLADQRLGRAWLIQLAGETIGYLVLGHCFSFEHGGLDAFLDEIYLAPAFRRRGIGRAALAFVQQHCLASGIRVLHLEVESANRAARALYEKSGFRATRRPLLTWKCA